jgi:sialate O-acetylesterase
VGVTPSIVPQEELISIWMPWSVASNITVARNSISAVCWLYGRMIHEDLGGRPIGLIHAAQGGTVIELWSPPEALKDCDITQ